MNINTFTENILELIRRTSAYLPPDVEQVLSLATKMEEADSKADFALDLVLQNIGLAKGRSLPICQDTGLLNFYIKCPLGMDQMKIQKGCIFI